ncbi:MAG: alpha-glucan family phosphorylase [Bacteroidales bacterium]
METYPTLPSFPDRIHRIGTLASDLWWSWHPAAREVFRTLDYPLWRITAHNPVLMLRTIAPDRLEQVAREPRFLVAYDTAVAGLEEAYAARATWWREVAPADTGPDRPIAYFSAEFALHQSLPIYAGGLGVLAGDTCKEASDLGIPFVGVGFMYPQGYFHQDVTADGWQHEVYERLNWANAPIEPAVRQDGTTCVVAVPLGNRTVLAAVFVVKIGRVRLYLLDTDLEENAPWDRELSARLYGGNHETRVQQEIVLGLGGVRALHALGLDPALWHLNEGHAAFVSVQRIRTAIESGSTFEQAVQHIRHTTVFTTHTPVPAGHDAFPFHLVETHLAGAWGTLGTYRDQILALGAYDNGGGAMFNMTALALRTSGAVNGVSRLHGQVTRRMFAPMWPTVPEDLRPVRSITNGVHVPTWVATEMADLFTHYVATDWRARLDDLELWNRILDVPDEELWKARRALREFLFAFFRERGRHRWMEEHATPAQVVAAGTLLSPDALTIGFARRFTAYKRPELIFHDPDRLARLLSTPRRPVQLVFAGKAHPADDAGKHHLQRVYARALDPIFSGRIAFVNDYDLHVAHFLTQGCDVWLNTPRKPLEASGTSGMKAAVNGVPNLSIGDGWWAEGYNGANGWLIDGRANEDDLAATDAADSDALYRLLEEQIVPAFYDRDENDVPRRWLRIVKETIRTVTPYFSTRRMLKDYVEQMYLPLLSGSEAEV